MNPEPLVSIIINNYNYGRFLPDAIESALAQRYAPLEVIVVDDGSTDASQDIITDYGQRVIPLLKTNGGQASAFNAGFEAAHGEIVIFLDADDWLSPDAVPRVVGAFLTQPDLVRVQYRLEEVDASGQPTGRLLPATRDALPNGALHQRVLSAPDDIPWLPTSGNAFASSALRQLLPMPEAPYRLCADFYLSNLTPLFGPVRSLEEVGGFYRVHGTNNHHRQGVNLEQTRSIITRTHETHRQIRRVAAALGLETPVPLTSVTFVAHRLISLRLDRERHPLPGDTMPLLLGLGMRAAARRPASSRGRRVAYMLWFLAAALAPRQLLPWLAVRAFDAGSPESSPKRIIFPLQHRRKRRRSWPASAKSRPDHGRHEQPLTGERG